MNTFKCLGSYLAALALTGVLFASFASAQVIEWGPSPTFKATQDTQGPSQLFKITGGLASFTCNEVHAGGNLVPSVADGASATTTSTSSVEYSHAGLPEHKCLGPLETEPKIEPKSCSYTFHAETTVNEDELTASVDVNCSGTDEITLNAGALCLAHVPPQTGLKHVLFKTETPLTSPGTVTGEATVSGIKYKHTGLCGNGEGTNGTYEGKVTITAFEESTQISLKAT